MTETAYARHSLRISRSRNHRRNPDSKHPRCSVQNNFPRYRERSKKKSISSSSKKTIPNYYYTRGYRKVFETGSDSFHDSSLPLPPSKKEKKKKVKVGIHCIKSLRGLILDTEWMLAFAACFLSRERTRETTHQFSNAMNPICIPFPFRSAGR